MNKDLAKQAAAAEALAYMPDGGIVGIGTGSTVNHFIPLLASIKDRFEGAVASSKATAARLREVGIQVHDLNHVKTVAVYVDGADEATRERYLSKGGGGALTREKIIAACAMSFVCIMDMSKLVSRLGAFPITVEVIPIAREWVRHCLLDLGGVAKWRRGVITDNGNHILDVSRLDVSDPVALEIAITQITGVVECGIFGRRCADVLLVAGDNGVQVL